MESTFNSNFDFEAFEQLGLKQFESMAETLSRKSDKVVRAISKIMLTIWPEQDKQVLAILKASQKIKEIKGK